MEALTSVFATLNLDNTIWIQLGCFLVSYLALSNLVFKPYYKAYLARQARTVGGTEDAEKMATETAELTEKFEERTREINGEYKKIYDAEKVAATKACTEKVTAARAEAQEYADKVRAQVTEEVNKAKSELDKEVPAVSAAMTAKLIGKEVSL